MNRFHKKAKRNDKIATGIIYTVAAFFILLLFVLTFYIIYQGAIVVTPDLLGFSGDGIGKQLFNTLYLVFISLMISVPIGIFAGIYMSEYTKAGKLTNIIRLCIETLSSLPSIVVGLFGFLVFLQLTHSQPSVIAGACAISILSIPLITRVTEEAIRYLPESFREGSYSLGATKWQTIARVLLPSATPRIITGIILAAGRGFGEAAALIFTAGMNSDVNFSNWDITSITSPLNIFRTCDTLAVHIWSLKTMGMGEFSVSLANLSAAVLVIMVLVFNIGSRLVGKLIEQKMQGHK